MQVQVDDPARAHECAILEEHLGTSSQGAATLVATPLRAQPLERHVRLNPMHNRTLYGSLART